MKYKVHYTFSGFGFSIIEAKNEEEASDKFSNGEFESDEEGGMNYEIDEVVKL